MIKIRGMKMNFFHVILEVNLIYAVGVLAGGEN